MNQDVIQVPFGGVAASKLHGLFERGYTVCGVAIQRTTQNSNFDRGAITTGGMVMWWRPEQHKSELHRLHEENQTLHEKNGLLKYALTAYEKPKEQGHGAAPAPQNLYQITGNVADVNTVLIERAELHRLQAENDGLRALASGGIDLFERYSTFKAKCAELEAMLDAVGAGGVGQSIKPQVQADTAPAAWAIYSDDGTAIRLWSKNKATAQDAADKFGRPLVPLYAAPQPTENLRCESTQKRLATLWGYVKKEPDHLRGITKMVPVSQMLEALRTKYSDLIYESNQKMAVQFEEDIFTINEFLQRIQQEAAEKEREACAALCDDIVQEEEGKLDRDYNREGAAEELAALIRARGQQ